MEEEVIEQIHNLSGMAATSLIFIGALFYSFISLIGSLIDLFAAWVKKKIDKGDKKDNV